MKKEMRFLSLNEYCKNVFGEKVYRLSLQSGCSCPNRDGKVSYGGCIFCSEGGSGDFAASYNPSIQTQLEEAKLRIQDKTDCDKFIAYFQAYTNTYAPVEYLRKIFTEAISSPDVAALSIGTRSDCLPEDVLELLSKLSNIKPVWIELGLQTIHTKTHELLNTHTSVEIFTEAVEKLHQKNIPVIAHVIIGLPGETKEMMLETVRFVASSKVSGIKLQGLHILKGTRLCDLYTKDPFPMFELEEYCDFIVDCIELLPEDMVIHRLTGDGPRKLLVAPLWSTDKKRVLNTIHKRLKERDTWQGKYFASPCK